MNAYDYFKKKYSTKFIYFGLNQDYMIRKANLKDAEDLDDFKLSKKTMKQIKQAENEFKQGKFYTHEQLRKILGL